MIRSLLLTWSLMPFIALAADDSRISFLEQEVRNLQRQVQALSRQLDELRTRPDRPALKTSPQSLAAPVSASPQWVDANKWRELRRGMSEIDVISSLGPPTSLRRESAAKVLLYALEIGGGGYLGGSVILREGAVAEIHVPSLQ
jgi:hypothetical protein